MKRTEIISLQGDRPIFRNTREPRFENVTQRTFGDKLVDFFPAQGVRHIWLKSAEYLEAIVEKRNFKKLKQATLKVAIKDLGLQNEPNLGLSLKQKIKDTFRSAIGSPKLKRKV